MRESIGASVCKRDRDLGWALRNLLVLIGKEQRQHPAELIEPCAILLRVVENGRTHSQMDVLMAKGLPTPNRGSSRRRAGPRLDPHRRSGVGPSESLLQRIAVRLVSQAGWVEVEHSGRVELCRPRFRKNHSKGRASVVRSSHFLGKGGSLIRPLTGEKPLECDSMPDPQPLRAAVYQPRSRASEARACSGSGNLVAGRRPAAW